MSRLGDGGGDQVELLAALGRDGAATLGRGPEDALSLELLDDAADDTASGLLVVRATNSALGGSAVDASESTDTGAPTDVDSAGNGGGADVIPIGVDGGVLTVRTSLDQINPLGQLKSAGLLEVSSVGLDESVGVDVLDSDGWAMGSGHSGQQEEER